MADQVLPAVDVVPRVRPHVLVFDDDESACLAAHGALSDAGYDVDATTNAVALYRCVQNDAPRYDVIVVDGGRPELSAQEFGRRMRSRHPEVALVLATRSFSVLRAPYDAWIEKPYLPGALVELVKTAALSRERRRGRSTAC